MNIKDKDEVRTCKFCGDILPPRMIYCCKECYYEFEDIPDEDEEEDDE